VGIHVGGAGVAVAHVTAIDSDKPQLSSCDFLDGNDATSRGKALRELVEAKGLQGLPVNYVLSPQHYHLLQVEPPQVPAEELKEALRWRVKDLINFDIEDAILDTFPLPEESFRNRAVMVYVVVAKRSIIEEAEALIKAAGLELRSVDIAELTLCNLMPKDEQQAQGSALVLIQGGEGVLNLVKDQTLYLTRNVKADPQQLCGGELLSNATFNHLVLEIQRSLDYYESGLAQPPATRLLLVPVGEGSSEIQDALDVSFGLRATLLDLGEVLSGSEVLEPQQQARCTLAMAAAMRQQAS